MIASGTRLRFTVQGNIGLALLGESNGATIRSKAIGIFSADPLYFTVEDLTVTVTGRLDAAMRGEFFSSPYRADLQLVTYGDYGTIGDLVRIVQNVFYQATGNVPSVSSLDQGITQGAAVTSTGTSAQSLINSITSTVTTTEILIVGGILVLAWIVATGPNVGKIARAVR